MLCARTHANTPCNDKSQAASIEMRSQKRAALEADDAMQATMVAAASTKRQKVSKSVNVEKQRVVAKVTQILEKIDSKKREHEESSTKQASQTGVLLEKETEPGRREVVEALIEEGRAKWLACSSYLSKLRDEVVALQGDIERADVTEKIGTAFHGMQEKMKTLNQGATKEFKDNIMQCNRNQKEQKQTVARAQAGARAKTERENRPKPPSTPS